MNDVLFLGVSGLIFLGSVLLGIRKSIKVSESGTGVSTLNILTAGVFLSAVFLLIPLYHQQYADWPNAGFHCIVSSIHHAIQLFTVRADRSFIKTCYTLFPAPLSHVFAIFLSVEYIMAPALTFSFIAAFFKNTSAHIRYWLRHGTDAYVFSELNEKSVTLAGSIKQADPQATIVFTDVFDEKEEEAFELVKEAKRIRAICFKKDILAINFDKHAPEKKLCFFAIGENEAKCLSQSIELIGKYRAHPFSQLFAFTSRPEYEYLLSKKARGQAGDPGQEAMKIRRVNAITSLIYHNLYNEGYQLLYDTAQAQMGASLPGSPAKKIVAVIVGLGQYGTEMLKSLSWFCQMEGYQLHIEAFDKDPLILDRLAAACPELIGAAFQGKKDDAFYQIHIHPGVDVTTDSFVRAVKALRETTYVLVALGSDEMNIRMATSIRMYFAQAKVSIKGEARPRPMIQAIVYSPQKSRGPGGLSNYKDESYAVSLIGGIDQSYSQDIIMNSALEQEAKAFHSVYYPEETFYEYEYNYRSSCAAAIHIRAIAHELSKAGIEKEAFTQSLAWADRLQKLAQYFAAQAGAADGLTAQLRAWAHDFHGLAADVRDHAAGFSWRAAEEKALIPDDARYVSAWDGLIRQWKQIVAAGRKNDPAWRVAPDPYSGLDGPITLDFLENSIGAGFQGGADGFRDNLYYLLLIVHLTEQEHKRWNAYMRSEGYVYSGSNDQKSRYDLAKMHHDLTPYSTMNPLDKNKDVHVDMIIRQIRQIL